MLYDISELSNLENTIKILQKDISKGVFYLEGDLGTGKTQFVRTWLNLLGYNEAIPSPTWNIINEYQINDKNIIHADLYRISDAEELIYLDVDLWQERADLIFIEWAEKGQGFVPEADFILTFTLESSFRFLKFTTNLRKML